MEIPVLEIEKTSNVRSYDNDELDVSKNKMRQVLGQNCMSKVKGIRNEIGCLIMPRL